MTTRVKESLSSDSSDLAARVHALIARLKAIREEARHPGRDFNLDYQLGMVLADFEAALAAALAPKPEKEK